MSEPAASRRPGPSAASRVDADVEAADCRCLCGNLLARWVDDAVELKCRRCKRTLRVPLSPGPARGAPRRVPVLPVGEAG